MCLAIPFRLSEINGKEAMGELDGVKRKIRIDFIKDPHEGEYVLVHAGFAIQKIDKEQAEENLKVIREVTDAV